jgi:hypothetical protein
VHICFYTYMASSMSAVFVFRSYIQNPDLGFFRICCSFIV